MQPSTYDIQREVEALRDIRRRSTTPGALTIDPDLPNPTSPTSTPYWSGDESSNSSNEDSTSSADHTTVETDDDPFHLFWVPASVHPEIAPAEFREFLREHSRSPPPGDGNNSASVSRSSSLSSSSLGRKKSMLSRQYRPTENDGIEEEHIVPLSRTRSTRYTNQGPQLTISDLQKLEELAEEASESDDPTKLRNILRRSLSMNMSPTAIDNMKNMPDMDDEADAPIIIPPRGQILRRANRTKIRKPGLPGDGGGHRFGASRRGRSATLPQERTSSDQSSSDHGEPEVKPRPIKDSAAVARPDSFSEETSIYDAYIDEDDDKILVTTSPPPEEDFVEIMTPVEPQPEVTLHHPQPIGLLTPKIPPEPPRPSRTPSPSASAPDTPSPPAFLSSPPPQTHHHRKEKDKKGLFGKWGSDKSGKKGKDHSRSESADRAEKEKEKEREKEKDSRFFGSLFGGKKSKDSDGSAPSGSAQGHIAGREAAQALLGASKSSKSFQPPPSPGAQAISNYSRYPIHVERAIYRLSHIKLANPRRPLYEQVLISNLMFWYLGIINKAQNPQANGQAGANGGAAASPNKEQQEQEQREEEQREKERQEQERQEREQREREREMEMKTQQREVSPKRGPLTKPAPMSGGGARRAEIPVKGPQYEMQHREMEQAYGSYGGGYNGGSPPGQNAQGRRSPGVGQRTHQPPQGPPRLIPPSESQPSEQFYFSPDMAPNQSQQMYQQRLPPGAMPPKDLGGRPAPGSPRQHTPSPPPPSNPQRRSRSPPPPMPNPQGMYGNNAVTGLGGGRSPSRSLSATAAIPLTPSPPSTTPNGKLRKGVSAHAALPKGSSPTRISQPLPNGDAAEEEDMPLAQWQRQRRR